MDEFGVSLRLGMIICMVSRVKQSIWKGFFNYGTGFGKFLGCGWRIDYEKVKEKMMKLEGVEEVEG